MPRKLGRTSKERNALLRNLASQLLWYGKIETTAAKAKELEMQIYAIEQQTKMTISHAMIVDYLNKMMDISDTTDDEVLQTIFNNFVDKIIVDDETIEIHLFVSPSTDQFGYKQNFGQPQWSLSSNIKRV